MVEMKTSSFVIRCGSGGDDDGFLFIFFCFFCFFFSLSGVSNFHVSLKRSADPTWQLSWNMRLFWSMWFELDNIYLYLSRREYLEHKFKTVKTLNLNNLFIRPFVKIPYYIWVGAQREPVPVETPKGTRSGRRAEGSRDLALQPW